MTALTLVQFVQPFKFSHATGPTNTHVPPTPRQHQPQVPNSFLFDLSDKVFCSLKSTKGFVCTVALLLVLMTASVTTKGSRVLVFMH